MAANMPYIPAGPVDMDKLYYPIDVDAHSRGEPTDYVSYKDGKIYTLSECPADAVAAFVVDLVTPEGVILRGLDAIRWNLYQLRPELFDGPPDVQGEQIEPWPPGGGSLTP